MYVNLRFFLSLSSSHPVQPDRPETAPFRRDRRSQEERNSHCRMRGREVLLANIATHLLQLHVNGIGDLS